MPSDKFDQPAEPLPRKKWWLLPLLTLIVLGALGFVGLKAYRRFEPERLARRAKELMKTGDLHGAALTLTRALQIDSSSTAASRTMAELLEQTQLPQAISWRQRVADLNPGSLPDALAWANLALREGKSGMAAYALETVPAEARDSAEWQSKSGLAAIRSGRWRTAREHFVAASRLEPENQMHRYNLALVQTQSLDPQERAAGFATLRDTSLQGRVRVFAQRAVIAQLLRDKRQDEALAASTALIESPDAETIDFTVQIDLLQKMQRDSAEVLASAKRRAMGDGPQAAILIQWLCLRGQAEEGLAWSNQLLDAIVTNPAVKAACGECLHALGRWAEFKTAAVKANWGPANWRRQALLAHAAAALQQPAESDAFWSAAVQTAGHDLGRQAQLAALASSWGWKRQMREALWKAADSVNPDWALKTLHHGYLADGDTANLLRVAQRQAEYDPRDLRARNNAALCQLLLESDVQGALRDAGKLSLEAPEDTVIRSTYAFALLVNKRVPQALTEIEKIPKEKLKDPSLALYYGLIQAAVGNVDAARELFLISEKSKLLPEEKALVAVALKRAAQEPPTQ